MSDTQGRTEHRGQFALLGERRFAPFFLAQFCGAFNDNLLKNALVVLVTYQAGRFLTQGSAFDGVQSGVIVNVAAAVFILPFLLFSATAGQLADKYEKSKLIRLIKAVEIGIMGLGAWAFATSNLALLLVTLFLSGVQSTLFGPVKYSILPQALDEAELVGGNALVESGTFVAILLGTIAGGYLASLSSAPLMIGTVALTIALFGFLASWFVPSAAPADATLRIDWNPVRETWRNLSFVRTNRTVFLSILGISWFWLYGALFLSQFPEYAKVVLRGGESSVTLLLAAFSVGIGIGSLLCERLSGRKIEIGLVPFGSIGITLFGVDLFFASRALPLETISSVSALLSSLPHLRVAIDVMMAGVFGGFYIVPLYALIQTRTDKSRVSRVVAANNVLNALFMVSGAVIAIALLKVGLGVAEILLVAALLNAVIAIYIYSLVPEFLMRFMVWMLVHSIYRLEKTGLDRIPEEGAAVVVCNHVSYVDALVVSAACRRPIRWVMDARIFRIPLLSFFFRTVRAIAIAPSKEDPDTLVQAYEEIARALESGELIGIFPEGQLTADGEIGTFKGGVQRILQRNPVPVIPMALSGLWQSLFARNRHRLAKLFPRIALAVGQPVHGTAATPQQLRATVAQLRGDWK